MRHRSPSPSKECRANLAERTRAVSRGFDRWGASLVHIVVALVLLFAQREATLHWLSHATEAATTKHALLASSDPCDECASISMLDSAVHSEPMPVPTFAFQRLAQPASEWVSAASLLQLGYASRGPPGLS